MPCCSAAYLLLPIRFGFALALVVDEDPPFAFVVFHFDDHALVLLSLSLDFPYPLMPERRQLSGWSFYLFLLFITVASAAVPCPSSTGLDTW